MIKFKKIAILAVIIIIGGFASLFAMRDRGNNNESVFCIQDAKLCSNGSYVSRVPPKCGFALCPKEDLIMVESPKPREKISSPISIKGRARGTWFFEATFPIKLYGEAGELIAQSYATAQSEWMTTDFVSFEANLEFTIDKEQAGILVLEKDNPSGLPEHSNEIRVPVILK